jgi:Leucine-rich repeat (LRR) protein
MALFDNNLFSTIPAELGQLRELELLDLGSNQFTGSIPTTLGLMEGLGK